VTLEADFAPLKDLSAENQTDDAEVDPYQRDSLHAQAAFDRAVEAATHGDEELAITQYLTASKIAETAREWYLAAVSCQRVGDFLQNPKPPADLERAFRLYRRAVAAYERCGLFAEARELSYYLMRLRMRRARELQLPLARRLELYLYWATAGLACGRCASLAPQPPSCCSMAYSTGCSMVSSPLVYKGTRVCGMRFISAASPLQPSGTETFCRRLTRSSWRC
jgi:hypothetical protein